MSSRVALLVALLAAGCSLSRATLIDGTRDAAQGGMDSSMSLTDGGTDVRDVGSGGSDAFVGAMDASVEVDAAIDDAAMDDAAVDDAFDPGPDAYDPGPDAYTPPLRGCDEIYRDLASYELCGESATDCELYVLLSGTSCNDACGAHGGSCLISYANGFGGSNCGRASGGDPCDWTHTDEICVCSRVP
jgi:hypothetical protein